MKRLIRSILGGACDRIIGSANGVDALKAYFDYRPDWVLMDLRLPGIDGLEAARQILEGSPDARVAMVTNCVDSELILAARLADIREYVAKSDLLRPRNLIR